MRNTLRTRDGVVFELVPEERELEETWGPSRRMLEVLEEFCEASRLSRRSREWLGDGFVPYAPTKGLPAGHLPRLRTPGAPRRFSSEWWKQRYARLKADPARYAKALAQGRAWAREKYRSDADYRKRRNADAAQRVRAWYARVKLDPQRWAALRENRRRRAARGRAAANRPERAREEAA